MILSFEIAATLCKLSIKIIFDDVRDGEKGAIWCLLSIIPTIPVVYYRKLILEIIEKIKL